MSSNELVMSDLTTRRIFVGGLAPTVGEVELKQRFERFGQVSDLCLKSKNISGMPAKTFAHLNITASADKLKQCMTAYNNCQWKGHKMTIQWAKDNFLEKLRGEVKDRVTAPAKLETEPEPEMAPKRRVVSGAKPGQAVPGEQDWVVGKFGMALPVVKLRSKSSGKLVKMDPSKYTHCLKRLPPCGDEVVNGDVTDLTWSLNGDSKLAKLQNRAEKRRKLPEKIGKKSEEKSLNSVMLNGSLLENSLTQDNDSVSQRLRPNAGENSDSEDSFRVCKKSRLRDESNHGQVLANEKPGATVTSHPVDSGAESDDSRGSADTDEIARRSKTQKTKTKVVKMTMDSSKISEFSSGLGDSKFIMTKTCVEKDEMDLEYLKKLNEENDRRIQKEKQRRMVLDSSAAASDRLGGVRSAAVANKKSGIPITSQEVDDGAESDDSKSSADTDEIVRMTKIHSTKQRREAFKMATMDSSIVSEYSSGLGDSNSNTCSLKMKTPIKDDEMDLDYLKKLNEEDDRRIRNRQQNQNGANCDSETSPGMITLVESSGSSEPSYFSDDDENESELDQECEVKDGGSTGVVINDEETSDSDNDDNAGDTDNSSSDGDDSDSDDNGDDDDDGSDSDNDEAESHTVVKISSSQIKKNRGNDSAMTLGKKSENDSEKEASGICETKSDELEAKLIVRQNAKDFFSSSSDSDSEEPISGRNSAAVTAAANIVEKAKMSLNSGSKCPVPGSGDKPIDGAAGRSKKKAEKWDDKKRKEKVEKEGKQKTYQTKIEKHTSDNQKRLESVKQKEAAMKNQKRAIQDALASLDSGGVSVNKKIKFDSDSDDEVADDKIQPSTSTLTPDTPHNSTSGVTSQKQASRLFDDEDESESSSDENERFRLRPEYEGKKGKELIKLQSRFAGDDDRFRLDARFLNSSSSDDDRDSDSNDHDHDSSHRGADESTTVQSDEKARNMKILESVVGHAVVEKRKSTFKDAVHYDPTRDDHQNLLIQHKKTDKSDDKKKAKKQSSAAPEPAPAPVAPVVSGDRFYDVKTSAIKDAMTGQQALFNFFGDDDDDIVIDDSTAMETDSAELIKKPSVTTGWSALADDSSSDDEHSDNDAVTTDDVTDQAADDVTETRRETFFFQPDDPRIKEGIESFYAKEDPEEIRRQWLERRDGLVELYKTLKRKRRHQNRKNQLRSMTSKNQARSTPNKRGRRGR